MVSTDAPIPFGFFCSFYILAIFVFLNLFVAVLLEKFEREFGVVEDSDDEDEEESTHDIKMTKHDLVIFRDIWERHTRRHARIENNEAKTTFMQKLFKTQQTTPDLATKHMKQFVNELPAGHPLGVCREVSAHAIQRLIGSSRCSGACVEPFLTDCL